MRRVINAYLQDIGVSVWLDRKTYSDLVDVFYCNFIGSDEKFYSMLVVYNDTQILLDPQIYLGYASDFCGDEILDAQCRALEEPVSNLQLGRCLRCFSDKGDWLVGRWKKEDAALINRELRARLNACFSDGCEACGYALVSHRLWTRPALGFSLMYSRYNVYVGTISVWTGCKTRLVYEHDLREFVKELGIEDYILWEGDVKGDAEVCEMQ